MDTGFHWDALVLFDPAIMPKSAWPRRGTLAGSKRTRASQWKPVSTASFMAARADMEWNTPTLVRVPRRAATCRRTDARSATKCA